ncbi:flagellar protein FliT [Anaerobacillus sp. MEB173]|uniref:flagellar protein FliT n=1 Tax=Anaerobacillus sp. MEB173 TaxID=3383345 RepID=UPI003F8E61E9
MSTIKAVYEVTKQLFDHLQMQMPKEERESYIERIEQLLAEREDLIKQLKDTPTDSERKLGQVIVKMNHEINSKLKIASVMINRDISDLNRKKETNKRYDHPYESVYTDGLFFDKKK